MAARPRPLPDRARTLLRSRILLYAGLFAGAAAISGFTILRGGAPFDEGLVLQAARRVADGQLPYRDFLWPYGPAQPYLFGGSFELLGPSLLWWRILRVAMDATVAVLVYTLVARQAPRRLAAVGWLVAACAMAQPTSASPFPPALALALLSFAVATRLPASKLGMLLAGALCGLAASWRLDFAVYAAAAVLVVALTGSEPARRRAAGAGRFAAAAAAVGMLAYLPFLIVVGPVDLYDSLLGSSLRERDYWTLPFPLSYSGGLKPWPPGAAAEDLKDLLGFYLPAICVAALALAAVATALDWRAGSRSARTQAGLVALAGGGLLYLLSRTDEFHTTPLIVVLATVLPVALARARARPLALALGAALVLLAGHGAANRLSALLSPPALVAIDVPVADGAKAPPAEAAGLEGMVAGVQRLTEPGEPIYAITRRSDLVRFNQPLIYVLSGRDNPTDRDFGLQSAAADQRRTVATLRRVRPRAIVRWNAPISVQREPNLRGRPSGSRALDRYIAAAYVTSSESGDYEVLVPRP